MRAFDLPKMTVSEIVKRIAPTATEAQRTRILRQIRHWTMAGVLSPDGEVHSGPGVHRRYDDESLYIAVVLVELARWQIPVGILQRIGRQLTRTELFSSKQMLHLWESAAAGKPTVMLIAMLDGGADDHTIRITLHGGTDLPAFKGDASSEILLDLTSIFSRLAV